jgi:hypothetical protein
MKMKSKFHQKKLVLTFDRSDVDSGKAWPLQEALVREGFKILGSLDSGPISLEYPLYTSKEEANVIYKEVQKKLALT